MGTSIDGYKPLVACMFCANKLSRTRRLCFPVNLFCCLSVCPLDYSESSERTLVKFFGGVGSGPRTKYLDVGGDPTHNPDPELFHLYSPDR